MHYNMAHLLGAKYSFEDEEHDLLSHIPSDFLLEWMKANSPLAAVFVARNIALLSFDKNSNVCSLTEKACLILDNFAENPNVLNDLVINLVEFGWEVSRIPYLERRISALQSLLKHPDKKINRWAEDIISKMKKDIENQKQQDDEQRFLIS